MCTCIQFQHLLLIYCVSLKTTQVYRHLSKDLFLLGLQILIIKNGFVKIYTS